MSIVFGPGPEETAAEQAPVPVIKSNNNIVFRLDNTESGRALLRDSETLRILLPRYNDTDRILQLAEIDGDTLTNIMRLYDGGTSAEFSLEELYNVLSALNFLANRALAGRVIDEANFGALAQMLGALESFHFFIDLVHKRLVQALKTEPLEHIRAAFALQELPATRARHGSALVGPPKRSHDDSEPWLRLCAAGLTEWFDTLTAQRFWALAALSRETQALFDAHCVDKVTWARVCPRQPPQHESWERFYLGLDTHGVDPETVRVLNLRGCIFPTRVADFTQRSTNALALLRTLHFPRLERLLLGGVEGDHFLLRYTEAPVFPPYSSDDNNRDRISKYIFDEAVLFVPQQPVDQDDVQWRQELDNRDIDDPDAWPDASERDGHRQLRALRLQDVSPYITGGSAVLNELNSPPLTCAVEFANAWTTHNTVALDHSAMARLPVEERVLIPSRVDNTTRELGLSHLHFLEWAARREYPTIKALNTLPPLPHLRWLYIENPFDHNDEYLSETKKIQFLDWLIRFVHAHPSLQHIHVFDTNAFAGSVMNFLYVRLAPEDRYARADNIRRAVELWRELLHVTRNKLTLHNHMRSVTPVTYCTPEWPEGDVLPLARQGAVFGPQVHFKAHGQNVSFTTHGGTQ